MQTKSLICILSRRANIQVCNLGNSAFVVITKEAMVDFSSSFISKASLENNNFIAGNDTIVNQLFVENSVQPVAINPTRWKDNWPSRLFRRITGHYPSISTTNNVIPIIWNLRKESFAGDSGQLDGMHKIGSRLFSSILVFNNNFDGLRFS